MNEEEKKAIEEILLFMKEELKAKHSCFTKKQFLALQKLFNLINKQQSEIEDLKETIDRKNQTLKDLNIMAVDRDSIIEKDKIRAKIKEYDKWIEEGGDYTESLEAQRYALNELLEEN